MAGLRLDPWEALVLDQALGERRNGKWSAFEVAVEVSRQNGKGAILEARELAGLFLFGERLIIHSAHQFDTSIEHFRRLLELLESRDEFTRRVKRISRSHGEEGIELHGPSGRRRTGGQRIRFRTRTKGGGRGFTCDCLIFDEAMDLPEMAHGAILPTLSARPNPQVWYTGSAVDKLIHENGIVFARIRERGLSGKDPSLAYFRWGCDGESPAKLDERVLDDPEQWARANPALGIRISAEHIARERRSMDARTFAVERLGVGDWPSTDGEARVIPGDVWARGIDARSEVLDPVCLAFDVTPDRQTTSIAAAGKREDDFAHIEVIERRRGTGWAPVRIAELVATHKPVAVICDGASPAASLVAEIDRLGVEVTIASAKEYTRACGVFFDSCEQGLIRHLNTSDLNAAIKGAASRPLGDAWAWSRKRSGIDISPLVACTLAHWGSQTLGTRESAYQEKELLILK